MNMTYLLVQKKLSAIFTCEDWNTCAKYAMTIFKVGQKICDKRGLILVDTKYEF